MSPSRFLTLPLVIMLLLAIALGIGLTRYNPYEVTPSKLIGTQLPPITLPLLGDPHKNISLESFKGKVTMINVFASWCVPCTMEVPALLKLAKANKVEMIGIVWKDKADEASKWLKQYGNPYGQVAFDANGDITVPLGLSGVPETFIVDSDNTIVYNYKSHLTDDMIENTILPLIRKLQNHAPSS